MSDPDLNPSPPHDRFKRVIRRDDQRGGDTLEVATPTGTSEIDRLAPWFHNIRLNDGRETAPNHALGDFPRFKWDEIAQHIPRDLAGWSGLDIGCNAGFYTFALAERGAAMLGVDVDDHYLRQARWVRDHLGPFGSTPDFRRGTIYEFASSQTQFDIVWFMGVFYHLRYPLLGLDIAAARTKRLLVFQSLTIEESVASLRRSAASIPRGRDNGGGQVQPHAANTRGAAGLAGHAPEVHGENTVQQQRNIPYDLSFDDRFRLAEPDWPRMSFIEHRLAGDATNWWAPTQAGIEAMLRSAGLEIIAHPGHEIYVCRPAKNRDAEQRCRIDEELASATGLQRRGT